jgi:hypothetical protein
VLSPSASRILGIVIAFLLVASPFIAAIVVTAVIPPTTPNSGFGDANTVLTFIAGASVGIERAIEGVWGVVNMKTPWWPLNALTSSVRSFEDEFDALVDGPLKNLGGELQTAVGVLAQAGEAQADVAARLASVEATRADLHRRAIAVRRLGPGNERLKLMTDIVLEADAQAATPLLNAGNAALNDAGAAIRNASSVATTALQVVGAFKDNPGRRVLSLTLGATVGIAVAGYTGLNVFLAAAQSTPQTTSIASAAPGQPSVGRSPAAPSPLDGQPGVLLTGLIIGLGSGPTHEVIKILQQTKQSKKSSMSESIKKGSEATDSPVEGLNTDAAIRLARATAIRPVKL